MRGSPAEVFLEKPGGFAKEITQLLEVRLSCLSLVKQVVPRQLGSWAKKQAELREDCGGSASGRVFEGDPEVRVTINKM